jgi:ribonuclease VapC
MIAVDTSIIAAIAFNEPERELFISRILASERALISTATLIEVRIVIRSRSNEQGAYFVEEFLKLPSFEIVAVDASIADIASQAYVAFGKGSGHPAQLNFGDVFSYALAKAKSIPLLFKGNDFSHTDVQICRWQ